jgi:hypothetical protein
VIGILGGLGLFVGLVAMTIGAVLILEDLAVWWSRRRRARRARLERELVRRRGGWPSARSPWLDEMSEVFIWPATSRSPEPGSWQRAVSGSER